MKPYDAVIIGSGIGGLTAAGILVSQGLRILLLEKEPTPGGYLASFRRNGFLFDAAVDCIAGATGEGLIGQVLDRLGVADRIGFVRVDPIRSSVFPDHLVTVTADLEEYADHLAGLFPHERSGIMRFCEQASDVYEHLRSAVLSARAGGARIGVLSADALRCLGASYADFVASHIADKQLKAVLSDRCPFIGLPPSRVSAAAMIALIMSYFRLGAHRPLGGFQSLADRMVEGIRSRGGEVLFGTRAERIELDRDGLCCGVGCDNGETYRTDHVVSGGDFVSTFSALLGGPYSAVSEAMRSSPGVSTSFFVVYAGMAGDIPLGSSSIGHFPSYDMESFFVSGKELCEDSTIGLTVASIDDPSRAPKDCHTVVLHEMVSIRAVIPDRETSCELMLRKAEKIIPGLRGNIRVLETATPKTFERYTDNHCGAACGWNQTPGFRGVKRSGIRNLHIAGHWGDFGGGVLSAAYAGARSASAVLSAKGVPCAF